MNYDQTTRKTETYCVIHKSTTCQEGGWVYRTWETNEGAVTGWACAKTQYPEFVTNSIREERVTYANDMIQSHRGGELSREFLEAHPQRAKQMLRDGVITKEEIKKAKNVWKGDIPGMTKKVDAESLIK